MLRLGGKGSRLAGSIASTEKNVEMEKQLRRGSWDSFRATGAQRFWSYGRLEIKIKSARN